MTVRTAVVRLTADVAGLLAGYGKAEAATKSLASSGMVLSQKHKAAVNTVTKGFGLVGAAAVAGLGLAVKTAADFDQKMSGVKAATGEGADGMDSLRAAAIKAGADTVFSAGEAADGITNLAKAGISTSDILKGGLNGALALASAGQIEVGAAAEYTATALTQFGLKGNQASHVADLLAAGANKAQGEVGDMATALNYAGIPAAQLGVSIEQTAGTIALFAKSGLIGSQAGTSLRGVLSSITSPSKVAREEMDGLGISVFDAHGKFIGLDGVAQQLHDHMGNLTQEERSNALGRIFGNQQLQAANILYKNGAAGVDEWTKKVDDSGAAARTAATKMDNLKGDVEQLGGSLQTALIGTGEGAQTPLRSVTQTLTGLVNKYNDLGPAAQSNVAKAVGAVALLGGGGYVVGKAVIGISNIADALDNLSASGNGVKGTLSTIGKGLVVAGALYGIDQIGKHLLEADDNAHLLHQDLQYMAMGLPVAPPVDFGFKNLGQEIREAKQEMDIFGKSGPPQSILGFDTSFMQTSDNIRSLDKALANLAKTDPTAAASSFAEIRKQAHAAGVSLQDLMALFPQYEQLVHSHRSKANIIDYADLGAGLHSLQRYRDGLMALPKAVLIRVANPNLLTTTKQVEQLAHQYKGLDAHDIRVIMRARDFATPEIHKVLKSLHLLDSQHPKPPIDADPKPLQNRYHQSKALLLDLSHQRPRPKFLADPDPFNKAFRLAMAQAGIFDRKHAVALLDGDPRKFSAAYRLAMAQAGVLDRQHPNATLDANPRPALSAINSVLHQLGLVHDKSVTITVTTNHRGGTTSSSGGRTAPDTSAATGGHIRGPGTSTSDSIPARLSDGEYVVRTAAVNYYGPDFFHKANAMQLAGGGYVSRDQVTYGPYMTGRGVGADAVSVTLTDAQFRRLEAATERGTARGAARGMKVLTNAITAEESF